MRCLLTRRDVLRLFAVAVPAVAVGWKQIDFFDQQLVCVHVYDPSQELPAPLLEPATAPGGRSPAQELFHAGLPELVLCRSNTRFLDLYPYFWPISSEDVNRMKRSLAVLYQKQKVTGLTDVDRLQAAFAVRQRPGKEAPIFFAVVFTLNDATEAAAAAVVRACRRMQVDELVIFKDPSRPPYLCTFATEQKGFKRPPPIG